MEIFSKYPFLDYVIWRYVHDYKVMVLKSSKVSVYKVLK